VSAHFRGRCGDAVQRVLRLQATQAAAERKRKKLAVITAARAALLDWGVGGPVPRGVTGVAALGAPEAMEVDEDDDEARAAGIHLVIGKPEPSRRGRGRKSRGRGRVGGGRGRGRAGAKGHDYWAMGGGNLGNNAPFRISKAHRQGMREKSREQCPRAHSRSPAPMHYGWRVSPLHPQPRRLARHLRAPRHHRGPLSTWHLRARGRGPCSSICGQNAGGTRKNSQRKGLSTRPPSYTISHPNLKSFSPRLSPSPSPPHPHSLPSIPPRPFPPCALAPLPTLPHQQMLPHALTQVLQASSSSSSSSSSPPAQDACNSGAVCPSYGASSAEGRTTLKPN
jgi:hypothetical protein